MTKTNEAVVHLLKLSQSLLNQFVLARLTGQVFDKDAGIWSGAMGTVNSIERMLLELRDEPMVTVDGVDMPISEATAMLEKMGMQKALQDCVTAMDYANKQMTYQHPFFVEKLEQAKQVLANVPEAGLYPAPEVIDGNP